MCCLMVVLLGANEGDDAAVGEGDAGAAEHEHDAAAAAPTGDAGASPEKPTPPQAKRAASNVSKKN